MIVIAGFLPDQAALYSVLLKIDRLGVTLMGLESSEVDAVQEETKISAQ